VVPAVLVVLVALVDQQVPDPGWPLTASMVSAVLVAEADRGVQVVLAQTLSMRVLRVM
jgi:hypothetical protein